MDPSYVHGYDRREARRLGDQESTLRHLLHHDTAFADGALVLEPGCGRGSQTGNLAARYPRARFVSFDWAAAQVADARRALAAADLANVALLRADLFRPPFGEGGFDHILLCFVLEHLADPLGALAVLKPLLKPGGRITVVEGDHGSCYFHPETAAARRVWQCLIDCQRRLGGNALIGRELFPLLTRAGYRDVAVSPRMVYGDDGRPALRRDFVKKVIVPMVEGVGERSLADGLIDAATWARGIADLHRTAEPPEGTFCYCFFKGTARAD